MTRTLYLHIGSHKTGTTSIQRYLHANQAQLAARGYGYPITDDAINLGGITSGHSDEGDLNANFGRMGKRRNAIAARLVDDPNPNVIGSSEGFSYLHHGPDIAKFRDLLVQHFSTIRIITYLRRQDQLAVSHHQEGANPQKKPAVLLHGHSPTALPDPSDLQRRYMDYATRIGLWADAFGDAAMVIRVYDRALLKSGDAVADFLEIVGLGDLDCARVPERNVSLGFIPSKLGHILNAVVSSTEIKASVMSRLPPDGKLLPPRDDARAFLAPYVAGNRALNARFSISPRPDLFSDDFSAYPEQGQQNWTEDTANAALIACAEVIGNLSTGKASFSADEYIAAAKALTATRPDLADKFMSAALNIHPDSKRLAAKRTRLQSQRDAEQLLEDAPIPAKPLRKMRRKQRPSA